MDKRAVQILFRTYWSTAGWRHEEEQVVAPEDFAYAKAARVMFDPVSLSHAQIVRSAIAARNALNPQLVADAFVASLTTRRLDLRSALGSYAVLRLFPEHAYTARDKQCAVCGTYGRESDWVDLNVFNFERLKWGGVRHDQPTYAAFDLEQFMATDCPSPSITDIRLFHRLIKCIEAVPPDTSAAKLSGQLAAVGIKANKNERDVLVGILGLCGILGTDAHPGYSKQYVHYAERELPSRRFVDMHYPACWWQGHAGINQEALGLFFGHLL